MGSAQPLRARVIVSDSWNPAQPEDQRAAAAAAIGIAFAAAARPGPRRLERNVAQLAGDAEPPVEFGAVTLVIAAPAERGEQARMGGHAPLGSEGQIGLDLAVGAGRAGLQIIGRQVDASGEELPGQTRVNLRVRSVGGTARVMRVV